MAEAQIWQERVEAMSRARALLNLGGGLVGDHYAALVRDAPAVVESS